MRRHLSIRGIQHGIDSFHYPGWEKHAVQTVAEGLELARSLQPEVIAIVLPDGDFPAIVASFLDAAPHAGVLLVTDLVLDEETRSRVFDAGAILLFEGGWRGRRAELTFEEANQIAIDITESVARVASERHRSRSALN